MTPSAGVAGQMLSPYKMRPRYALVWGALRAKWIVFANEGFYPGEKYKSKTKFRH